MQRHELARAIRSIAHLTGEFRLRSGATVCVIDREAGASEALRKIDLPLRSLFTKTEFDAFSA